MYCSSNIDNDSLSIIKRICLTMMLNENNNPKTTPNLPTKIADFGGFDSGRILSLRGGIPRPTGNFLETLRLWFKESSYGESLGARHTLVCQNTCPLLLPH